MDVFNLTVQQLTTNLKNAQLTSVDLCKSYIERIKKFEKDIHAWAHFDEKVLLEKAEESDNYRRSGKPLGLLHGIPVALKDFFSFNIERAIHPEPIPTSKKLRLFLYL